MFNRIRGKLLPLRKRFVQNAINLHGGDELSLVFNPHQMSINRTRLPYRRVATTDKKL